MLHTIIAALFGGTFLGCSIWAAWIGVQKNSPAMACMAMTLVVVAATFGLAAVQMGTH